MSTYKSDRQPIGCPIQTLYDKLSTPAVFENHLRANLDHLPAEARDHLDKLQFASDSISVETPMGPVRLAVDAARSQMPTRVVYTAQQSPVDFSLIVDLADRGDGTTDSEATLNVDLPFFLKGFVGKHLEEGAKKFGQLLAMLPWNSL